MYHLLIHLCKVFNLYHDLIHLYGYICRKFLAVLFNMKILHLSDTHGMHRRLRNLPEADVVVHSGDFCMVGTESEALDFLNWFCDLPYSHKIFICGNHDEALYGASLSGLDENVCYLCNSSVIINGVKFYGVSMFMSDSFSGRQEDFYNEVPADVDVLVTHAPPHKVLDFDGGFHYGSEVLLHRVTCIAPRAHLFGHIHSQHGTLTQDNTIFSNAAIMNESYDLLNSPNIIEI